ncbi:MAG: multicomponent Na+:H+ antiporter subunit E [Cryomorphaceae bacterium]|jgi:multicomponent Na+:H+ antiporter subunit E
MLDHRKRTMRALGLLIIFVAAWLLWSGLYKPVLLGLGAFSCALCVYLANRMGFYREVSGLHVIPKLPRYWAWLLVEIIKSSFEVAKIVLDPKLPISPTVVEIDALPEGPIGQAILGNAITLSPGTVTLDVYEGRLRVHCLTSKGAQELLAGEANRRTAALTSS